MKIGFYGDSYCDLQFFHNSYYLENPLAYPRELKTWPARIIDDFDSKILSSGLGGSSLFHAIATWKKDLVRFKENPYDVVIFTFSWWQRMYTPHEYFEPVFLAKAERRPLPVSEHADIDFEEISHGIDLYYKYFCQEDEQQFYYELSLKYILSLADQYPDTKFIFLPCNEFARNLSLKHFTKGVLLNFSFETLSNLEPGSPGIMPYMCGRPGHLNDHNHESFAALIAGIISNYQDHKNQILDPDFSKFDLTAVPVFNRSV